MSGTEHSTVVPPGREVVAVAVTWRGHLGLFKRSRSVGSDVGRWHCITGFVEGTEASLACAVRELYEETGLAVQDLAVLQPGAVLDLADDVGGRWTVHTFRAESRRRCLRLNEEHDAYRWVSPSRIARFDGRVTWLDEVLKAVELHGTCGRIAIPDLEPVLVGT